MKDEKKLSTWKSKTLSVGDILTLPKYVLGSLPDYFMTLFKAPIAVISQLEALRNNFFTEDWAEKA